MGSMTVRNIPDDIHKALKLRAAMNKRSAEAEVRAILEETVVSAKQGGFGQRLAHCFDGVRGDDLAFERDKTAPEPEAFE